ncbi:MAG TPA: hypothetical protein VNE39_10085 [Planctomycetota bacterium]|nr:hypothetical protein [Planctomycetota bacterium]
MTSKQFLNALAHGETDILATLLEILAETASPYCVIGGLAVNAYAEPVVSLDLDLVVALESLDAVCAAAAARGLTVQRFEHSVNLASPKSDLRIQLQTDARYQSFLPRAVERDVLGYRLRVAALPDVLQGKLWAYQDAARRASKRQKDLADILRLVETDPTLKEQLPPGLAGPVG